MHPLLLIAACRSEYEVGPCNDCSKEESDSSNKWGLSGMDVEWPSAGFPSVDVCEKLEMYLPGLESSETTEEEEEEINGYDAVCPYDLASDTYVSSADGHVSACTNVIDTRLDSLASQALSLLWDDVDVWALLSCKLPLTIFAELNRTEPDSGEEIIEEATKLWITPGNHKEDEEVSGFETTGEFVNEDGEPIDTFPLDAAYLEGTHTRPLEEYEMQIVDPDHVREAILLMAVLPAYQGITSYNSFGFNFSLDENTYTELILTDNDDLDDEEKLTYTSDESSDYSLSTNMTTIPGIVNPLLESVATFCQIKVDFRGIERCVYYFEGEEE